MIGNILKDKLKVLKIYDNRILEIKNMIYKSFNQDGLGIKDCKENQIILLNKLVEMIRWDPHQFKDWIDVLDSLHKMRNFNIYHKERYYGN